MIFFRGKDPETSVWRRFRTATDGFTFNQEGEHYTAHVVATAERVVDLLHSLSEQLPPAVDVVIDDLRSGRTYKGERMALPDVRDAVLRLKLLVAQYGGVEISLYTADDQLTINPYLELFIYARTDRWVYILQGKGLKEHRMVRTKSWKLKRQEFPAAPDLVAALDATASRLGMVRA